MRTTALVVVMTLPLAYLGAWVEQRYRKRQNLSYNSLILWNRRGVSHPFTPDRLVFQALAEIFAMNFVLFLTGSSAVLACVRAAQPLVAGGHQPAWPMLWIAAAGGAIMALRMRKAYAVAAAALLVGIFVTI